MKKITCLLALFLCVIGTAMAQIANISDLSNDKKYAAGIALRRIRLSKNPCLASC